jgi:hypothetical protein
MNRINSTLAIALTGAAIAGFFLGKLDASYFESLVSIAIGFFFGGSLSNKPTPATPVIQTPVTPAKVN